MAICDLQKQTNINIQEKANLIWNIATHLVGLYKPHIIKNLRIAFPDLDEQQDIVSYLDKKTSYIDELVALKTKK